MTREEEETVGRVRDIFYAITADVLINKNLEMHYVDVRKAIGELGEMIQHNERINKNESALYVLAFKYYQLNDLIFERLARQYDD